MKFDLALESDLNLNFGIPWKVTLVCLLFSPLDTATVSCIMCVICIMCVNCIMCDALNAGGTERMRLYTAS